MEITAPVCVLTLTRGPWTIYGESHRHRGLSPSWQWTKHLARGPWFCAICSPGVFLCTTRPRPPEAAMPSGITSSPLEARGHHEDRAYWPATLFSCLRLCGCHPVLFREIKTYSQYLTRGFIRVFPSQSTFSSHEKESCGGDHIMTDSCGFSQGRSGERGLWYGAPQCGPAEPQRAIRVGKVASYLFWSSGISSRKWLYHAILQGESKCSQN